MLGGDRCSGRGRGVGTVGGHLPASSSFLLILHQILLRGSGWQLEISLPFALPGRQCIGSGVGGPVFTLSPAGGALSSPCPFGLPFLRSRLELHHEPLKKSLLTQLLSLSVWLPWEFLLCPSPAVPIQMPTSSSREGTVPVLLSAVSPLPSAVSGRRRPGLTSV
jgi:hypothetical protein